MKLKYQIWFIISLVGCNYSDKYNSQGSNNAVWVESIYLRGYNPSNGIKLSDEMIYKFTQTLKDNKIKYVYLFSGPYESDGHLPQYPFSKHAISTIRKIKKSYPSLHILPWIGGIQNKTVYLGDSSWVNNALNDTERLISTLGCDGVHIDLEFILKEDQYLAKTINPEKIGDEANYGPNVNKFHRRLRDRLPKTFISSVVTATSTATKPWKRKTTMAELKELTSYVDQISFLFYDTGIRKQQVFKESCEELIADIKSLKSAQPQKQFLIAIGTFVNDPQLRKYRNLNIENIPNSLKTIKEADGDRVVDGISIFCDWETDRQEWAEFRKNWR